MNINKVMSYAADRIGLSGDLDGTACFEPETARSIRFLLKKGYVERRERIVDIKPESYGGNYREMQPLGPTKIVTWHLTDSGRAHWLSS